MSNIDWTQRELIFILAGSGLLLIVLSLMIRYRSAKRGSFLVFAIGIIGGLVLGFAGGLYYRPPLPGWFSSTAEWFTVERGDIVITAVEPGELEPAEITYEVCKLHASNPNGAASNILWVIEECEMVKKGDLLVLLDDSEWKKELREKALTPARRKFLEEQIANCRILAPRDGLVIYYIEQRNRPFGSATAQGEMVREGQKLLFVCDLSKLVVKTRISESQIDRVKLGQAARVGINRFPGRTLAGQVSHISNVPTKPDPRKDILYYAVWIKLSDPIAGLAPDMIAKVSLELARLDNVLRVPTEALLHNGSKTFCFVKSGRQIDIRTVYIGLSGSQFTVVEDGLKEGEQVLRGGAWQGFSVRATER